MLRFEDMGYRHGRVIREGEIDAAEARGWVALVNRAIAGNADPLFSVDVVELEGFPVTSSTGLRITVPGHRIFLALMEFRPTCRVDAVAMLTQAKAILYSDETSDGLRVGLRSAQAARQTLREWSVDLPVALRREQIAREIACEAIQGAVEDLTNWDPIPLGVQVYAYAWVIDETAEVAS